jgi:hypothetical protein
MGKFLKGSQLNAALEELFEAAEDYLVIISPYIKLHPRLKDILKSKSKSDKLEVIVVFGKNEGDLSKSLNVDDLDFLKAFPNVEIRHEPRLHAKYYANESSGILSSMNLYDFSQNNNIEFGILSKTSKLMSDPLDKEAYKYFEEVIENSTLLFNRIPWYEDKFLGISSKYTHSEVEVDLLDDYFKPSKSKAIVPALHNGYKPGFCIRTGVRIFFNPNMPFSESAYKEWGKYKNRDYKEKYCHFSGELSNGETSFAKPILRKNWSKANAQEANF